MMIAIKLEGKYLVTSKEGLDLEILFHGSPAP